MDRDHLAICGTVHPMWNGYLRPWGGTGRPAGAVGVAATELIADAGGFPLIYLKNDKPGGGGIDTARHRGESICRLLLVGHNAGPAWDTTYLIQGTTDDDSTLFQDLMLMNAVNGIRYGGDIPLYDNINAQSLSGTPIIISGGYYPKVRGGVFYDIGGYGVTCGTNFCSVQGATFGNCATAINSGNNQQIYSGNTINNCQQAFQLGNSTGSILANNVINGLTSASLDGIFCGNCYGTVIEGNTINTKASGSSHAINMQGGGSNSVITGNVATGGWNNCKESAYATGSNAASLNTSLPGCSPAAILPASPASKPVAAPVP